MNETKIVEVKKEYICDALDIAEKAWEPIRESQKKLMGEEIFNIIFKNWREEKRNDVRNSLESGNGFIALCDGKVAGFSTYRLLFELNCGEIMNNAVSPEFRGMGIAGLMHKKSCETFKENGLRVAKVSTGLDEGHAPARKAYEKAGFKLSLPSVKYYMKLDKNIKPEVFDDLEIVPYKSEYLEDIFKIALKSWDIIHKAYKVHIGEEIHDIVNNGWEERLKKSTENLLENERGFVALVDGKVTGYATYRTEFNGKLGVFAYNSVSDDFRGKRIASRLYNKIKCEMVNSGCIYARVVTGLDDGHAPARRAYEKTGFDHPVPETTYYMMLD